MTRQEFLKLHKQALRAGQRRGMWALVWAGVAAAVLVPPTCLLGKYIAEHAEVFEFMRRIGMRGPLAVAGAAALLCAFFVRPLHGYGVPCPNCHELLYRNGVILGIISSNCCHCGRPLFADETAGVKPKSG